MTDFWSGLLKPMRREKRPGGRGLPRPTVRGKVGDPRPEARKLKPGDRVGEWTLLEYIPGFNPKSGVGKRRHPHWVCQCSCGVKRHVRSDNLLAGLTHSCGHVTGSYHPVTR